MKLQTIFNKSVHVLQKNAPALLTGAGIIGLGATGYLAYKAAPKVEAVVEEMEEDRDSGIELDKVGYTRDLAMAIALPVTVGAASISAFVLSYNIQNKRILGLSGALTTMAGERAYYENKFRNDYGDEEYEKFRQPSHKEKAKVKDDKGKEKEQEVEVRDDLPSLRGAWFDKSEEYIKDDHDYNVQFIRSVEEHLSTKLFRDGFLYLNEVYDALGLERTRQGNILGFTTGSSFQMDMDVSNFYDKEEMTLLPQIYVSWNEPRPIYDRADFK